MDQNTERNVRSIDEAPLEVLPAGPIRKSLRLMAASGYDVYVYKAAGSDGPWNVWLWGRREALDEYIARWTMGVRQ